MRRFGAAIKRGALGLLGGVPAKPEGRRPESAPAASGSEAEARLHAADAAAYSVAHQRLVAELDARIAAYEPGLRQRDVDAVSWNYPVPLHHILKPEVERIRRYAWDVLRALGFPVYSRDESLQAEMGESVKHIIWLLHQKCFSGLKLPLFFEMRNGFLDYESSHWTESRCSGTVRGSYPVGFRSGYRYSEYPYLLEKPTLYGDH